MCTKRNAPWTLALALGLPACPPPPQSTRRVCTLDPNPRPACPPPLQSTRRVYNTFCTLDDDANGFLSRPEFSAISNGTMSPLFIKRIFEEHIMRERALLGRGSGYRCEGTAGQGLGVQV